MATLTWGVAGGRPTGPCSAGVVRFRERTDSVRVPERSVPTYPGFEAVQWRKPEDDRWDYDRLYELLDVVSNFDPKFEIPIFSAPVLGEVDASSQKALHVLGRGRSSTRPTGASLLYGIHALFLSR